MNGVCQAHHRRGRYETVRTCQQCGAVAPLSAAWCSQCYLPFGVATPELAFAGAVSAGPSAPAATSVGWAPQAQPGVPVRPRPPAAVVEDDSTDGRLLDRKAAVLVAAAISFGGLIQLIALAISHVTSIEPEALIRYDIVLTLGTYAVVAAMIVSQITTSVRLWWGDGSLLARVGIGAGFGVGISLVLLTAVSLAAGHLQSDPRLVLLMSAGDRTHILVTVFIACVAAPLVEETLFRGLLLESLRPRGKTLAVVVSAGAFAVWHFMPASLVYYAALGAVLGSLYLRRGLAASIAAHVGFNAVLTVAAIMIVLGPSHAVRLGGLTMTAPSGWSVDNSPAAQASGADMVLVGPDDAQLEVVPGPPPAGISPDVVAQQLRDGDLALAPSLQVDTRSVTEVMTPAGEAVEAGLQVDGRQGTLALLTAGGRSYEFAFLTAGSDKAQQDFNEMLASLRTG
jgi:membrane protease YdiL (CAAX protease family)